MNPFDELHRGRLAKSIETSYRSREWARNLKRGMVEAYAGSGYGKPNRPRRETIVNLAMQTVEAHTMALVANRPRILASSTKPELTYFAKHFTVAMNNYIEEIGFEFALRKWVVDAFFGMGVIKLHLADSGMVQLELDRWADPGKPYASNISIDNFVFDVEAPAWESVRYAGDSYRIAFSDLDHPMFDQQAVDDLVASKRTENDDRTDRLSRGDESGNDELEDMFDLADIWIPKDGKIYTFQIGNRGQFQIKGPPVAVMDWDGDERGPYPILSFSDVPDNIEPTSLMASLAAQERLINNILRKNARNAMAQKKITSFPAGAEKDAQAFQKASDGDVINVNNPDQITQTEFGGVSPISQAFAQSLMMMYDRSAGNLTGMMGLGAQAPTKGQEEIIQSRLSSKGASMQYRVLDATSRLIRSLAYMLWQDKAKSIPGQISIDGAEGYSLPADWTPDDREGSFFDYDIQIDVFSMAYQSPEERWSKVASFVTQQYAPMAQFFMEQGLQLDLNEYVNLAADMMNVPQLKHCIKTANPTPMEAEQSAGPASTNRSYERRSVAAGPTPQNAANQQIEQWMAMDAKGNGAMRGNPA